MNTFTKIIRALGETALFLVTPYLFFPDYGEYFDRVCEIWREKA